MSELLPFFLWIAKAFVCLSGILLLAIFYQGFWFLWKVITQTFYLWNLSIKWNKFRSLSPEAKLEAMKDKRFSFPDEDTDEKTHDKG